jgi:acyl-CoA synthetase (AMP-forming)/AMP-acid ligase II
MIKVRGMSVFPSELEVLLGRHPAVLGSAVVARPIASAARCRWHSSACAPVTTTRRRRH